MKKSFLCLNSNIVRLVQLKISKKRNFCKKIAQKRNFVDRPKIRGFKNKKCENGLKTQL